MKLMKKIYFQPNIEVVRTLSVNMICGSKDIQSDKGIDYGGVDVEGTKDPSSRRIDNWDDEEEDEF